MFTKNRYNKLRMLIISSIVLCLYVGTSFAEDIRINVATDKVLGELNPLIFGNALVGYYINGKDYKGNSNYGSGIWDPEGKRSVPEVINLAKNIRMSILRFPGGQHDYDWKKTIGTASLRPNYLFGIDEFLKTAEEIGSQVVYTLPYYIGTAEDAADLVEYLNAERGKNPGGGIDWANRRAQNGHPEPYNVKYFEIGNEVDSGIPEYGFPAIDAEAYADKYVEYKKAMTAIDPSIFVGAVTVNSAQSKGMSSWNHKVFERAGGQIDFLIEHTYMPRVMNENFENENMDRLYENLLGSLPLVERFYRKLSGHFEAVTGRKNIPLAVTEYNGGYAQDKPVPFRHSLGTALFNAGLMQIFMNPENNILMANNHQYVNSYWGMIKNDKFMLGKGHYIKRPNYYTMEMFSRHFGSDLLDVRIEEPVSKDKHDLSEKADLLSNTAWKRDFVFGVNIDVGNDGTVRLEFERGKDINFHHIHKKVSVKPDTTYVLSAYMRAENLNDKEGVCIEIQDGRGWQLRNNKTTEKIWGSNDWTHVEMEYTTLKDTSDITVIIRRLGGHGIISGKAYIRDVKLTEKKAGNTKKADSLMVSGSLDRVNNTVYIMVLNKSISEDIGASVIINGKLSEEVTAWTLTGPDIWSVNEVDPDTVTIKESPIKINSGNQIDHVFPAHSLTSLEFNYLN